MTFHSESNSFIQTLPVLVNSDYHIRPKLSRWLDKIGLL